MLDINKISKTFNPGTVNEKTAVKDLSLHLDDGEFVTIIGANGAGKSTLFNAICGNFYTDSGSIILDGKDITFYADKHPIHTATSTVDDMGGFYDEPVWIGEQISYVVGDTLRALVTPGVSFNVGKVLLYDDMPTVSADVILFDTAVAIHNIRVEKDDL